MTRHEKLVRDLVPDHLTRLGVVHHTRTLRPAELEAALRAKMREEVDEFLATTSGDGHDLEELADILEVVYALARLGGVPEAGLDSIRVAKAERSGAFTRRVFLIDAAEPGEGS